MRKIKIMGMIVLVVGIICFIFTQSTLASSDWFSFPGGRLSPEESKVKVLKSDGTDIELDIQIDGIEVKEKTEDGQAFHRLIIPGGQHTTQIGKPELPVIRVLLAIPSSADNLKIDIARYNFSLLSDYNLYPVPKLVPKETPDGFIYFDEEFTIDEATYSQDSFYPGKLAEIKSTAFIREQRTAEVLLYPIQFNPITKEIKAYYNLELRLSYTIPKGMSSEISINTGPLRGILKNTLPNYQPSSLTIERVVTPGTVTYPTDLKGSNSADYLVITGDAFYSEGALNSHAWWRAINNGFDVAVVKVSTITAQFLSATTEQSIKDFITYVYSNWNAPHMDDGHVGYIFLVGDVDSIPMRDYWYTCVAGADTIGDIVVGRNSVEDNNHLNTTISKIIDYEKNRVLGEPWYEIITYVIAPRYGLPYPSTISSFMKDILPSWMKFNILDFALGYPDIQTILDAIDRGTIIFHWDGHGDEYGWNGFEKYDVDDLQNKGKLTFVISQACLTGKIDAPSECLGEAFIRAPNGGAIGFVGATISLSYLGAKSFCRGLYETIYKPKGELHILGQIVYQTKLLMSYIKDDFLLLGDPVLKLNLPEPPAVDIPDITLFADQSFNLDLDDYVSDPNYPDSDLKWTYSIKSLNWLEEKDILPDLQKIYMLTPSLIDLDNDTDLDLVVGEEGGILHYYKNAGTPITPNWQEDTTVFSGIDVGRFSAPAFTDLDNDGDYDLVIAGETLIGEDIIPGLHYYKNTGTSIAPVWQEDSTMLAGINVGLSSRPTFADLDNDGDYDLTIGDEAGTLNYYRNIGTAKNPKWQEVKFMFSKIDVGGYSSPTFADLDNDSDLDLIVGGMDTLVYYENIGTVSVPKWQEDPTMFLDIDILCHQRAPVFADINGDEIKDLIIGSENTGLFFFEKYMPGALDITIDTDHIATFTSSDTRSAYEVTFTATNPDGYYGSDIVKVKVLSPLEVSIFTDKAEYSPGDTMHTTIHLKNPSAKAQDVWFLWWVSIPEYNWKYPIMIRYLNLASGYDQTFNIPILVGSWGNKEFKAEWQVGLLEPNTYKLISLDTARWKYIPSIISSQEPRIFSDIIEELRRTVKDKLFPSNQSPVFSPIGDKTVNEESLLEFEVSATDPDGDSLTYSAENLPSGATFINQTFSWTPDYTQAGTYSVTFKVSDGKGGEDFEKIAITVNDVNQPPTARILSIRPNPAYQGQRVYFFGYGKDKDGKIIGYNWRSSIDGFLSSRSSFSTTKLSPGTHTIYFKVKDDKVAWSEEATRRVNIY